VGSFNELTNAGLAANDLQAHNYWGALLRLSGPLSRLFGEARGFCRLQNRPGFARPLGGFRGLGAKFDWFHIINNHAPWGAVAQHRILTGSGKDIFTDVETWGQLRSRVLSAWKNRELVERQWNAAEGVFRSKFRGTDPRSGQVLEFWFNEATRLVESAYPFRR
jgi:hypothetical protein